MRPALITAGATRNRIDAMRYISAHSSGQTGAHIADAVGPEGVWLLGSPEACLRAPAGIQTRSYADTVDLCTQMEAWVRAHPRGVVVHAAAVGDYMIDPADPLSSSKWRVHPPHAAPSPRSPPVRTGLMPASASR